MIPSSSRILICNNASSNHLKVQQLIDHTLNIIHLIAIIFFLPQLSPGNF